MPDGLINLQGADPEICKAFQDRLKGQFKHDDSLGNNVRTGHTYPVYGGPAAEFIPFQLSAKDMEIIEQQKWFTKLVWSAFGVTPDQMGYTEDSNKAVSQTQTGVYKKKALTPLLKKIEYAINTQLLVELDPSGVLEFHFEDYDLDE
jgi:phage portal protein BeeE